MSLKERIAKVDVEFPWPQLRELRTALGWDAKSSDGSPHHGSDSWADHLGLAPFNDNKKIKPRRRIVFAVLTCGLALPWYWARGLGSPPNNDSGG